MLSQGIHNQRFIDDDANLSPITRLVESPSLETLKLVVLNNTSGPLGRPLSMASFTIDAHYWPSDVNRLIRNNILLHILCGTCVIWFSFLLCRELRINTNESLKYAFLIGAIWVFHPLLVSTYLYSVQRMTVLASIFCLLSLVTYLKVRNNFYTNKPIKILTASLIMIAPLSMAMLSKENSFVILSLIGLTEILLINRLEIRLDRIRKALIAIALFSTAFTLAAWLVINFDRYSIPSQIRDFNAFERLMTQGRMLSNYLYNIVVPQRLGTGLFHDDIVVSRGLFVPLQTFWSLLFILGLIIFTIKYFNKVAFVCFALAWFFLAHFIESSVIPLELKYEHRNYLPLVGFIIGFVLFLSKSVSNQWMRKAPYLLLVFCIYTTFSSVSLWSKPLIQAEIWRAEHPTSIRATQHSASNWLSIGRTNDATTVLKMATEYHPDLISLLLQLLRLQCMSDSVDAQLVNKLPKLMVFGKVDYATPATIQELLKTLRSTHCDHIDLKQGTAIVDRIASNTRLASNSRLKAETLYVIAETHSIQGDHQKAAQYSNLSFSLDEDGKYAISETISWINAGDPMKAKDALQRAKQSSNSRNWSLKDQKIQFKLLEESIDRLEKDRSHID